MKNFETIYRENKTKIQKHIAIRIKNREEVEELTQDVFIKAWKSLSEFDTAKGQLSTWLYTIANNCVIDYYRKKKMELADIGMYTSDDDESGNVQVDNRFVESTTPHNVLIRKEAHANVQRRMSNLPANLRKLADMYFVQELNLAEICEATGMPLGTVKNGIYRSRVILQGQLVREHQPA
jgi:RNA polymerase sigma-70 factor (ECF subfamily)